MKRSVPISDDLSEYFANPCPVLSDNNSQFILDEIAKGYDYVVEYGMGASTLYCLQEAKKHPGTMVSVENNFDWFEICVQEIKNKTDFKENDSTALPWSLKDIQAFINASTDVDIPEQYKRLPNWKESLSTGSFFRFSPNSKSRFSGKLGPLWPLAKPLFSLLAKTFYLLYPQKRPHRAEWRGKKENLELILRNIGPSIKDQFGEAPNMQDYINAGLKDIRGKLEAGQSLSGLFIIDGGPRHKIVHAILALEDQYNTFQPTIILCDAHRAFYHETLKARPSGQFIAGSNKTLNGQTVAKGVKGPMSEYWANGEKNGEELAKQEIWVYAPNKVSSLKAS